MLFETNKFHHGAPYSGGRGNWPRCPPP